MNNIKNLVRLNKIHNKSKINNIIEIEFILILFVGIYFIVTEDLEFYTLINNLTQAAIIGTFVYVNIIQSKFVERTFMKNFNIVYVISTSLILLNIFEIVVLNRGTSIYYLLLLYSGKVTLEYYQINKILKFRSSIFKRIMLLINYATLILIFWWIYNEIYLTMAKHKIYFLPSIIAVNIIMSLLMCLFTLFNTLSFFEKMPIKELKKILLYIFSIVFNYVGIISLNFGNKEIAIVTMLIKFIAFYKFYNYVISKVLEDSLQKINNNIEVATKTKKELNSVLKKRNTILNETNLMIQKSQDKYNKLVDSIYGGIFLFYYNKLQYINKGTVGTLNMSNDENLGMDLNDFIERYFDITLEDLEKAHNYIPFAKMKYTNLDVDIFLSYEDKETTIVYIHDISDINENEKATKELEEYLEEDRLKQEFFANISHELKTPINSIFTALQMDNLYLSEGNMEGMKKNRMVIKQNCLRLIRTINNFIDANKVSEGYITPDFKIYNIVELVENISDSCNKYIKLAENTLIFDSEEEEVYVNCDKEMITRIILNILSNSVKYGKKGGSIKINIYSESENTVSIKVKNDGMKIGKEIIPYIFDKFTKLNKAFNRLKEGSGLGLFLTKALVELQGGNIKLISNSKGNGFIITMCRINETNKYEFMHEELAINSLEEKVDVEFSDIYIE